MCGADKLRAELWLSCWDREAGETTRREQSRYCTRVLAKRSDGLLSVVTGEGWPRLGASKLHSTPPSDTRVSQISHSTVCWAASSVGIINVITLYFFERSEVGWDQGKRRSGRDTNLRYLLPRTQRAWSSLACIIYMMNLSIVF